MFKSTSTDSQRQELKEYVIDKDKRAFGIAKKEF